MKSWIETISSGSTLRSTSRCFIDGDGSNFANCGAATANRWPLWANFARLFESCNLFGSIPKFERLVLRFALFDSSTETDSVKIGVDTLAISPEVAFEHTRIENKAMANTNWSSPGLGSVEGSFVPVDSIQTPPPEDEDWSYEEKWLPLILMNNNLV